MIKFHPPVSPRLPGEICGKSGIKARQVERFDQRQSNVIELGTPYFESVDIPAYDPITLHVVAKRNAQR